MQLEAVCLPAMLVSELVRGVIVGECQKLWLDTGDTEVHQRHFVCALEKQKIYICRRRQTV